MSASRIITCAVIALLVVLLVQRIRDPLRTGLPFGTTDLSSVQPALKRLSELIAPASRRT